MSARTRHLLGWILAAALLLSPALVENDEAHDDAVTLITPWHEMAASFDWVRFQRARLRGRSDLAITHAERALRRSPGDEAGWSLLADYLGLELGSRLSEPSPERRAHWLRAAVDVTRHGEPHARRPERLCLVRGLLFAAKATDDPELPWPGGPEGLWEAAARAFERAGALGYADADELAAHARAQL